MEARQMTPSLSSTFSALTVCNINFCIETSQNSFSCGLPFRRFRFIKYLNFGRKLPIRTAHHTFLESRQPRLLKVHIIFCPQRRAKKGISS